MPIDGFRWCRHTTQAALAALLMLFSAIGAAQQPERPLAPGKPVPDDYYRAEFVILQRIVDPDAVNEQMSGRTVEPPVQTDEVLWSVRADGTTQSTLNLAPRKDLHLASAADRLERSGRYRVLATAGWYEAFPPDYRGTPLRVEVGDWLEGAGTRAVEGHITIDRQRYLHVEVHLNHWQLAENSQPALPAAQPALAPETAAAPDATAPDELAEKVRPMTGLVANQDALAAAPLPLELVTWIRETRRMRSEEVHFLDSPTIGVLVFFKKIEAAE